MLFKDKNSTLLDVARQHFLDLCIFRLCFKRFVLLKRMIIDNERILTLKVFYTNKRI